VVVGSGVVLGVGNPKLLPLHVMSLLAGLSGLSDEARTKACPFVLEVAARWFHQSSTRELAMLGPIQVKIWMLAMGERDFDAFTREFQAMLSAALRRDELEPPGGAATRALKQIITFLYHNVDQVHGPARHKLLNVVLKEGFLRMFLNHSVEVMYGFHLMLVYKLLRFHRHHAGSASDMELLTRLGARVLRMDQAAIMETMQAVAEKKTRAANPWKAPNGKEEWVEELDIDRALMSQAHVLLDEVHKAPEKARALEQQAEAARRSGRYGGEGGSDGGGGPGGAVVAEEEDDTEEGEVLLLPDGDPEAAAAAAEKRVARAQRKAHLAAARAQKQRAAETAVEIASARVPLVEPALANFARQLWEYYTAGLKSKNDLALSIFAPPLTFPKAHAAFESPLFYPRPRVIPGVTSSASGFASFNAAAPGANALGRMVQDRPYSDYEDIGGGASGVGVGSPPPPPPPGDLL